MTNIDSRTYSFLSLRQTLSPRKRRVYARVFSQLGGLRDMRNPITLAQFAEVLKRQTSLDAEEKFAIYEIAEHIIRHRLRK